MECTYSAVSTLPNGITLNPTTGEISGTPTQVLSEQDFTIRRSNGCSNNTNTVRLTVLGIPSISYSSSYALALNEPVNIQPIMSNADSFSFVSGSLPSGLSFNNQTGAITGSPTSLVTSSIELLVSNELINTQMDVYFTVIRRIFQFSYETSSFEVALQSSISLSPQIMGSCREYLAARGPLPPGLTLDAKTGVISGTFSQAVENYQVTIWAENGLEFRSTILTFTVITPVTSFSYPFDQCILPRNESASLTPSVIGDFVTFSIVNGTLPSGLSLNSTTGVISGAPLSSIFSFISITFMATNKYGNKSCSLEMMVLTKPTVLSYPKKEYTIAVGETTILIPTGSGDLSTYSLQGNLPDGLEFIETTGMIIGVATSCMERKVVTIIASNAVGSASCWLALRALTRVSGFTYPKARYNLAKGRRYSFVPSFLGDETLFSIEGTLPQGLAFDSSTGTIEGTPIDSYAKSTVIVYAKNDISSATFSLRIIILPLPLSILILIPTIAILLIVIFILLYYWSHKKHLRIHSIREPKKRLQEPNVLSIPLQPMVSSQLIPQIIDIDPM